MKKLSVKQMRAGAKYLGERAHKAGKPRIPALDPAVLVMIGQNNGSGIVILKYWCKGWDSANLSAPVVGL